MAYDPLQFFDLYEHQAGYEFWLTTSGYANKPDWLAVAGQAALAADNAALVSGNPFCGFSLIPKPATYQTAFLQGKLSLSFLSPGAFPGKLLIGFLFMLSNVNPFQAGVAGYIVGQQYTNDTAGQNDGTISIGKFTNGIVTGFADVTWLHTVGFSNQPINTLKTTSVRWFHDSSIYDGVILELTSISGTYTILDDSAPIITTQGEEFVVLQESTDAIADVTQQYTYLDNLKTIELS